MFVDTHTHLDDSDYGESGAGQIAGDFEKDQIDFAVTVGCDLASSEKSILLSERFERVYAAVGVHPHDAKSYTEAAGSRLLQLGRHPKAVAYGEIGLDYHYDFSDRETQKRVFAAQLELADALGLPVIFHLREATGEANEIIKQNKHYLKRGGVLHCYANGAELVKFYADLGLYFGFGGSVTFQNARGLLDAVRAVPADRILTETDCPYLTPVPHRGETNYPKYVAFAAKKCAELRGIEMERFCAEARENALRLFSRIPRETYSKGEK